MFLKELFCYREVSLYFEQKMVFTSDQQRKANANKHGIELIFTRGQNLNPNSTLRGKKLEQQGIVYSVSFKSKICKIEYIGETGRQLKVRMKEHKADSKLDFRKKSCKNKITLPFRTSEEEIPSIRLEVDQDFGKRK